MSLAVIKIITNNNETFPKVRSCPFCVCNNLQHYTDMPSLYTCPLCGARIVVEKVEAEP